MAKIQRILFPTDFSKPAHHALEFAVHMARKLGAKIDLIHVLALHEADPALAEKEMPREVKPEWKDVVASQEILRALTPELGVIRTARDKGADLIVMGTHGRTGLKHILLGSVAERVVQLAQCAVLTVPPPDHEFERP